MYFNHSMNKLPPPVHPLSILGVPGIAQNMCEIAQYINPKLQHKLCLR